MCHILVVYIHCGCSARLEQSATTTSSMAQIISPCSQWLVKCHVTIQRCSAAPAPKFSGTEKLLPCHRLTPRRSFFPDWQTVGVPTCSLRLRFRPRWTQRGIRFQCRRIFPLCEKRQVPLQRLPRGQTQ